MSNMHTCQCAQPKPAKLDSVHQLNFRIIENQSSQQQQLGKEVPGPKSMCQSDRLSMLRKHAQNNAQQEMDAVISN